MPDYVREALSESTLAELAKNGHGISFPCRSVCQLRFSHKSRTLSYSYSYSKYGGVQKAIDAAMERYEILIKDRNMNKPPKGNYDGVHYLKARKKSRNSYEHSYSVSYVKPCGKYSSKKFYITSIPYGQPQIINADRQLHAYRTARLFRHISQNYEVDENVIAYFSVWKEIRLYTKNRDYFDWKSTA